jgi:phytoene dehydrogenase-like protein
MRKSAAVESSEALGSSPAFDAIVIGAGLGGLLSAAQLLQRGKRVLVLERLPHSGGRFTAKTFQGTQVSTGAVHMVPFGSSGVLSQMLQSLRVPHRLFDANVFGSFHVHGKHYIARGLPGVCKFLGLRQFFWLLWLGYLMFLRPLPAGEGYLSFDRWLERHIKVERNPQLVAFFKSVSRFALSLELSQVSAAEVTRITKNMLLFGPPGIVLGGCAELTRQLERHVLEQGGQIRLSCAVEQIYQADGHVTGVRIRDKRTGQESQISASFVISDIGPRATSALLHGQHITQGEVLQQKTQLDDETVPTEDMHKLLDLREAVDLVRDLHEAVGLKIHILSDVSLIPHTGIMYCLDTQRIAGMVQPTNSDPQLAPPGKHLLISHQVIQSNDIEHERALALADLRMLFGPAFDAHCRVLTMGTYRGEWPVNRVAQGEDRGSETSLQGLYMVGDAVKPTGYLMVEGVAQSVNCFLDLLDSFDHERAPSIRPAARHRLASKGPSRLNVLRWLWKAPGNADKD